MQGVAKQAYSPKKFVYIQSGHFSPESFYFSISNHLYPLVLPPLIPPLNIPEVVLYSPKDVLPLHPLEIPKPTDSNSSLHSDPWSLSHWLVVMGVTPDPRLDPHWGPVSVRSEAPFLWVCCWISPPVPLCSFPFVEINLESHNPAVGQTHMIIWIKLHFKNKSKKVQMDIGRESGEKRSNESAL